MESINNENVLKDNLTFPKQGVSLQFLHSLSATLQDDNDSKDITTMDIIDLLIDTTQPTQSIVNLLSHHKRHSKRAHPIISTPTVFLCYCWDYRCFDLIDTLCRHYPQCEWQSTFIWIDVFCLTPQQLLHHNDWCSGSVWKEGISKIGHTVVVNAPTDTYTAWLTAPPLRDPKCILELGYVAKNKDSKLTVLFHSEGEERRVQFNWSTEYEKPTRRLIDETIKVAKENDIGLADVSSGDIVSLLTKSLMTMLETQLTSGQSRFDNKDRNVHAVIDIYYQSIGCYILSSYQSKRYQKTVASEWFTRAKTLYHQLPKDWISNDRLKQLAKLELELVNWNYITAINVYEKLLGLQDELFGRTALDTIATLYTLATYYGSCSDFPHLSSDDYCGIKRYRELKIVGYYVEILKRYSELLGGTHAAMPSCVKLLMTQSAYQHYAFSLSDIQYIANHYGHSYCDMILQTVKPSQMTVTVPTLVHILQVYYHMREIDPEIEKRMEDLKTRVIDETLGTNLEQSIINSNNSVNNLSIIMGNLIQAKLHVDGDETVVDPVEQRLFHHIIELLEERVNQMRATLHGIPIEGANNAGNRLLRSMMEIMYGQILEQLGKSYLEYTNDHRYNRKCIECFQECYDLRQKRFGESDYRVTSTLTYRNKAYSRLMYVEIASFEDF